MFVVVCSFWRLVFVGVHLKAWNVYTGFQPQQTESSLLEYLRVFCIWGEDTVHGFMGMGI